MYDILCRTYLQALATLIAAPAAAARHHASSCMSGICHEDGGAAGIEADARAHICFPLYGGGTTQMQTTYQGPGVDHAHLAGVCQ